MFYSISKPFCQYDSKWIEIGEKMTRYIDLYKPIFPLHVHVFTETICITLNMNVRKLTND